LPLDRQDDGDGIHLTLLERKKLSRRTDRRLPLRYRDLLPEPPPAIPLLPVLPPVLIERAASPTPGAPADSLSVDTLNTRQGVFRTLRNAFHLFRRYTSSNRPSHNPEANATTDDLSDIVAQSESSDENPIAPSYDPYPNRNAFLLGEWYWNGGSQKSQSSFKDLLQIVGDPSFDPSDVRDINWKDVDEQLTQVGHIEDDTGWTRTPVTVLVPAQHHRKSSSLSGPQEFIVADFYHRSILSAVKEALSSPARHRHFHYEPCELLWQPPGLSNPISVHGELYTSPAFTQAHLDLQNSPPEPNCKLPRCIAALMFASDATHLTSFGDVKLWPLYLYFGNESKYRRCKPSENLCSHIAYFQGVRLFRHYDCMPPTHRLP
jgi:hypothetical protein